MNTKLVNTTALSVRMLPGLRAQENMVFGQTWELITRQPPFCLMPVGKRRVSITLPDGALYRFDAKNDPECAFSQVPQPNIDLVPVPGPSGGVPYGTTGYQHSAGPERHIDPRHPRPHAGGAIAPSCLTAY